uniref:uncharacterized protein n=1 Tax=Myxine glutinosa TaxID=7769 RepID=UPI00358F7EC4
MLTRREQLLGHSIGRRDTRLIMSRRSVALALAFCSLILTCASDLTPSPVTSSKGVLTAGVGTTAKTSVSERPSVSTGSRGSNSTMEPQSTSSSSEGSDAPTNVVSNTRETSENNTSSITPTSNKAAVTETESSSTMITVNTTSSDSGTQTTPLNNSTAKPSESEFTSSQNRLSFTETPTVPMSTTQTNPEIDSTTALSVVIQGLISTVTSQVTTSTLLHVGDESIAIIGLDKTDLPLHGQIQPALEHN